MKIIYVLPGIFFVIIFSLIIYENFFQPSSLCEMEQKFISSSYKGVIIKKIIDLENHATRKVQIKIDTSIIELILPSDTSSYYGYINVGDTVIKKKNYDKIIVIKGNRQREFKIYSECE